MTRSRKSAEGVMHAGNRHAAFAHCSGTTFHLRVGQNRPSVEIAYEESRVSLLVSGRLI